MDTVAKQQHLLFRTPALSIVGRHTGTGELGSKRHTSTFAPHMYGGYLLNPWPFPVNKEVVVKRHTVETRQIRRKTKDLQARPVPIFHIGSGPNLPAAPP